MANLEVTKLNEQNVYNGFFKMNKYDLEVETLDGLRKNKVVREVFERGNSVAVLIYDPVFEKVLMIEQFLVGAYVAGVDENSPLQVVAGMIDKNETPEQAALREAAEETGMNNVRRIIRGPIFMPSPGGSSERIFTFVAECDLSGVQSGYHGVKSENEDIRTVVLDAHEAIALLDKGLIENGLAVVLLSFLDRKFL